MKENEGGKFIMKRRRIMAMVLALVMVASMFALAACNSGGSSSTADTGSSAAAVDEGSSAAETGTSAGAGMKIGVTYYSLQNEFTVRMDNAGQAYCDENDITLVSYDGNYDAATQLAQTETMIAEGCDAIIIDPVDAEACAASVEAAYNAGIPCIGANAMVNSDVLTSYIGSQDVLAGQDIMQYMIDYLGRDDFNIVIIEGPMGQSAQLQRLEGIENILKDHPDITILAKQTANWSRSEAMTIMESWLKSYDNIDAVMGENDEMALGAREAIKAAGKDIPCIGVDGITDAVTAIQNGDMIASDFQNAEAQMIKAIEVAVAAANGEEVEDFYWIPFEMITPENVEDYVNKY